MVTRVVLSHAMSADVRRDLAALRAATGDPAVHLHLDGPRAYVATGAQLLPVDAQTYSALAAVCAADHGAIGGAR